MKRKRHNTPKTYVSKKSFKGKKHNNEENSHLKHMIHKLGYPEVMKKLVTRALVRA